jgi:hypothetical protein
MNASAIPPRLWAHLVAGAALLGLLLALPGCKSAPPKTDSTPLEQAGMYFDGIQQLHALNLSQGEVAQLAQARQAGLTDQDCVDLINLARRRDQPFQDGDGVAGMMRAGLQEKSVMTLAHLNELGPFAGEAQAMKLAGLSDDVILAVARRRNAGQPALSSAKAAALRNAALSNAQILDDVNNGFTDAQADAIITQHERAGGGHGFVHQAGTRHPHPNPHPDPQAQLGFKGYQ